MVFSCHKRAADAIDVIVELNHTRHTDIDIVNNIVVVVVVIGDINNYRHRIDYCVGIIVT